MFVRRIFAFRWRNEQTATVRGSSWRQCAEGANILGTDPLDPVNCPITKLCETNSHRLHLNNDNSYQSVGGLAAA
jgi:hypothetical protein